MRTTISVLLAAGTCLMGSASATAQSIDLATGGADPIWRGTQTGARAGASLDQGAVNSGDSRRDLIIGVPGGSTLAGAVYIVNGGPVRTGDLSLSTSDSVVRGAAAGDLFGSATASGNVITPENTLPRALVVGAPGALNGRGIVYLFAGAFRNGDSLTTANAVAQIIGNPGDQLGTALATADVNNDGYREIIVGAPGNHRVYVIGGGTFLSGTFDLSQSPPIMAMMFDLPGIGTSVAAGDITGDGIYELLIGQPSANTVYGIKGRTTMPAPSFDFVFTGIDPGDGAGSAIRLADLNGDGITDLVISAPNGDGPDNTRTDAGEAYVIWGSSTMASRNLASADVTFYGKEMSGRFSSLLASGDINRDTPNDLVVGSPAARSGAGAVDIYYGRSKNSIGVGRADGTRVVDFAAEAPSRSILGDTRGGTITAIQVFEVTGEGARDVIIGMSGNNGGVGAVYFTISPRLSLGTSNVTLSGNQGIATSSPVPVRNISTIPITWRTASDRSWLSATASGSTSATAFGDLVISANGNGLLPGTYTGTISVISTSVHLTMSQPISVTFTVNEAPGFPNPSTPPASGFPAGARYNILFRNDPSGYLALWQMNGLTLTGVQALSVNQMTDPAWRIAGYGDLNGDGERDIVWQHDADGWLAAWFMQGPQVLSTIFLSINKTDPNWKVRAVGDVDGDGKADLIFRHKDGWLAVWFMSGMQVTGTYFLSFNKLADPNWAIVGAGDADGDGRADIFWQNKVEGWLGVWTLNGTQVVSQQVLSIPKMNDPKWSVMGAADVNGDKRADILWEHEDGTVATWWLNGAQVVGTYVLNPPRLSSPTWKIAGPR
jgi:hypothetical protein